MAAEVLAPDSACSWLHTVYWDLDAPSLLGKPMISLRDLFEIIQIVSEVTAV